MENYLEYYAENTIETFFVCTTTQTIQIRMYSASVILGFLVWLFCALLQDLLSQFTYNTYSIHRGSIYAYINF